MSDDKDRPVKVCPRKSETVHKILQTAKNKSVLES